MAAGGGIPMAKHGNRAVSSKCGGADVAEALGAEMPDTPERAASCLDAAGLVLLFAPHFHPILRNVAEIRKNLGVRTIFNILGPLLNPAPLTHQVMGVFDPDMAPLLANVLLALGRERGMVISGHGGFDELSLSGPNRLVLFSEEGVREAVITPEEAGLARRGDDELSGGTATENAAIIEDILAGKKGAARDVVLLNASAVLPRLRHGLQLEGGGSRSPRRASTPAAPRKCWKKSVLSRSSGRTLSPVRHEGRSLK